MQRSSADGSAGDADYGRLGHSYPRYRQPDPRISELIHAALGPAHSVLNIGAGAGSYEPTDRMVTPIEPSASMRALRPPSLAPAIDATAEELPFAEGVFDSAMTTFSVHQWRDLRAGLSEARRVTRGPIVILTADPSRLDLFWLKEYAPEVIEVERRRYPSVETLAEGLGGRVHTTYVPIPLDCRDGFNEAYYGRPEMLLDPGARLANSAWSFVSGAMHRRFEEELSADLANGRWESRFGHLRKQQSFEGSLILVTSSRL